MLKFFFILRNVKVILLVISNLFIWWDYNMCYDHTTYTFSITKQSLVGS